MEREEAAHRLQELSLFLRDEFSVYADLLGEEKEAKALAFKEGQSGTLRGKPLGTTDMTRYIESCALLHTRHRIESEQRIAAYEEERDHLRFMLKHGLIEFI